MAGVPPNFQAISNVLPTYNYVDIIAGTGYVNFYAGTTVDLYQLSNFTYYSDAVLTTGSIIHTDYTKILDLDFDVDINRPINVQGLGIVNTPVLVSPNSSQPAAIYTVCTLRKWDGTTETDIITNTSTAKTNNTSATYYMLAIDLDIPLTHFKIGETLRLTIEVYGKSNNSAGSVSLGHDPLNRTTGWDSTGAVPSRLMFQCPVRLNL